MKGEEPNLPEPGDLEAATDVVAAYDSIDGTAAFVIGDISRDSAWIAVPASDALDVGQFQ